MKSLKRMKALKWKIIVIGASNVRVYYIFVALRVTIFVTMLSVENVSYHILENNLCKTLTIEATGDV